MTKNSKDEAPLLVIDWSPVCYKQWLRMGGDNYEAKSSLEDIEFARNMYLYMLFLTEAFQPHETILALDSRPNWRVETYKKYYLEHLKLFQKVHTEGDGSELVEEKEYLAVFDGKTVKFSYSEEAQKWMKKKLIKADVAKLDYDDYVEITSKKKKRVILYDTLKGLSPAYKGTRSSGNWDFATPKNGYTDSEGNVVLGFRELADKIAVSLAGTFTAKVIKAEDAEADDVAAYYVKNTKSPRDIILVSVDSDLHQLFLDSLFFKYFNPNVDEDGKLSHLGGFVALNKTGVLFNLRKKLLSGDSSDNIPGCMQYDEKILKKTNEKHLKPTLVGEKTAEKWLTEKKLKEIVSLVDPDTFERNRKLIHLDNIPDYVNENIAKAFKEAKVPKFVEHDEYPVTPLDILTIRHSALMRRGDFKEAEKINTEIEEADDTMKSSQVPQKDPEDMTKEELLVYAKNLKEERDKYAGEASWNGCEDRMGK